MEGVKQYIRPNRRALICRLGELIGKNDLKKGPQQEEEKRTTTKRPKWKVNKEC